ncbi:DUF2293 domain-containing protein [Marinilabiliaceae bacterium JC017]|nr:DUF2293 domain-containing protein [Marinilabiliaceae bacterium JC017]
MKGDIRIVNPGPGGSLLGEKGERLVPPNDWAFLPAGDAGVTRKVTSKGSFWRVQVKKGRRTISKGIWAPASTIEQAQRDVQAIRSTEAYEKKRQYDLQRRQKKQLEYEAAFCKEVENFLNFHPLHKPTEKIIARAVTTHAIPVGSGTVARTSMIPIEERAARAVIAWMRHNTTAYDNMHIARIKGERRAVRRMLAERSVALLAKYRQGKPIADDCPLQKAIRKNEK